MYFKIHLALSFKISFASILSVCQFILNFENLSLWLSIETGQASNIKKQFNDVEKTTLMTHHLENKLNRKVFWDIRIIITDIFAELTNKCEFLTLNHSIACFVLYFSENINDWFFATFNTSNSLFISLIFSATISAFSSTR